MGLKVHPEGAAGAEIPPEAERRFRQNTPLAGDDFTDAIGRHPQLEREHMGGQVPGREFCHESRAGMDGRKGEARRRGSGKFRLIEASPAPSVIVDDLDCFYTRVKYGSSAAVSQIRVLC